MSEVDPLSGPGVLVGGAAPTESTRSNSRAALIDAAFEEFTSKGYEATTVAGIAERAGVTTGALYAHFRGKLDLLLATVGLTPPDDIARSIDVLAALPRSATAQALTQRFRAAPDERTQLLLDVIVVARRDPRIAGVLRSGLEGYVSATAHAVAVATDAGAIDPVAGADDTSRLISLVNFGMIVLAALDAEPPSNEALRRAAEAILRTSRADDDPAITAPLARVNARAAAAATASDELHEAIVEAVDAGHSLRQVGTAAGMSHERVRQVLRQRR